MKRYRQSMTGENTQERVTELFKRVEEGVEKCRTEEGFKTYLKNQSKLYDYSFGNCMLIFAQCPEATYVAGFRTWQSFSTPEQPVYVRPGEKGIQIVAPAPYRKEVEVKDANGNPVHNADGTVQIQTVTVQAYKPTYVFDISQVEGADESMFSPCKTLEGDVTNYEEIKTALEQVSDAPISYKRIKGGANGFYSPAEHTITIRSNMSEAQTLKTLIHEISHSRLHTKATPEQEALFKRIGTEDLDEIAAVTYIVSEHYGIDSGAEYSFPYIATWADAQANELKDSLRVIQRTACQLVQEVDHQIATNRLAAKEELAYKVNGYGYLHIQRSVDGGYDYSLYNNKLRLIDGGRIEDDSLSMDEAAKDILVNDNWFEVYRICEIDVNRLMTQLESRDEAIRLLARDIATEIGMLTDRMEEAERNAIVTRVSADLDTCHPECIDMLRAMSETKEHVAELLEQAEQYIDIDTVQKAAAAHIV